MSDPIPQRSALIAQFEEHLATARYSATATKRYLAVAGHFIEFLRSRHVPIAAAQPSHVTKYLTNKVRSRQRSAAAI